MSHADGLEEQLRQFVLRSFLPEADPASLDDRSDLFALLDSLQVLRLVKRLEAAYYIEVTDDELTADNLGSVANVAAFVRRKGGEPATALLTPSS